MAAFAFKFNFNFVLINEKSLNFRHLRQLSIQVKPNSRVMPKDNSVLLEKLRQNRVNSAKKKADNKMPSNQFHLTVLGNGSKGNPKAVYLSTDRNSYLFNCGEGTQRLATEHKLKLSKLENIFITKRCSENLSGLVGLALTCQDIGIPSLTLHGPDNMELMLSLYEYFFKFSGMKVNANSYVGHHFEDLDLIVKCFPIFQSVDIKEESVKRLKIQRIDDKEVSFLYLCRLKSRPGELMVDKCRELKIPAGPLLGQLKSGKSITLADNRVIKAEDVIGPEDKGPVFIVLECQTVDYIDSLVTNEDIFNNLTKDDIISTVVHFTPEQVFSDIRYQEWAKRLGDSVHHLVLNEDNPSDGLIAVNRLQTKLNLIDSYVFPLLHSNEIQDSKQNNDLKNVIKSKILTKYHLRPKNIRGIDLECIVNIDVQSFKEEALSNPSFIDSLNQFQEFQSKQIIQTQEYPQIIFLGTGSAVPQKARNTSAIWVNIDSETALLLDCGEGTYGQIYRFYGNQCHSYIKRLKAIYVSHLHADHHLGILQIIKTRSLLTSDPLYLIIPPAVEKWLQNYNECVEKISDSYKIVLCQQFVSKTDEKLLKYLRLKQIQTVLVPHCSYSYGLSFTTSESNFKIVYSGDTQPTPNLWKIGQNCDLLIHEASMEDDLVEEARLKFHSTTSEAIKMGTDMNAKFTILTHFSQRYAKIPIFNEQFNDRVGIAFDNMRVRMSDLNKLPKMIPCLKSLFEDKLEQMKAKTANLIKRKEYLSKHLDNKQTNDS